ncbi:OOP family OmpA-OmpF porin [Oxalobacteraceae bacterium GrIS 2.11]
MKHLGSLTLLAAATCVTPFAVAQNSTDSSNSQNSAAWYMGANIGQSKAKIDNNSIHDVLIYDGATSVSISDDNRDTGYKVYGGYQINDNFAIEAGFFDLGKFSYLATTVPAGTVNGDIRLKGLNLDLLGFIPLTENFSVFGRVGMNYAQARDNFSASGIVAITDPNPSKRSLNYKFGLGLQYRLTQALAIRLEAERNRVDDAIGNKGDVDLYSVGLTYRFGQQTQMHAVAPVPVAPAPAPIVEVVPAPAPAPMPAPPAAPMKVSFSADSLFGFNQSDIKPEGRQAIDDFSAKLRGTSFDHITVTGHTDRIGSHADNMILSTKRAETVKKYLIDSAGIPAEKINAVGVDGADPVTKPEDCKGNKKTKALIACLQPDRRVDLEVTGTK